MTKALPQVTMVILVCMLKGQMLFGQSDNSRPQIRGIAHIAICTNDVPGAIQFYTKALGFSEAYSLQNPNGSHLITYLKVANRQYLELYCGARPTDDGHLSNLAFETDDAALMKSYLISHGMHVIRDIHTGLIGDLLFSVKDPDGHVLEFVQYTPQSWTLRDKDKFLSPAQIANHIDHAGLAVSSLTSALNFYRDVLGFRELSRAPIDNGQGVAIRMRTSDGTDFIELMVSEQATSSASKIALNRVGLSTATLSSSLEMLRARHVTFQDKNNHVNISDPAGTWIELSPQEARH